MASTILSRTISAVVDNRIVLSNSQFARPHGVSSSWTQLRVGVRWIMSTTGANITTPALWVGICSGSTSIVMDATTDNYCGVKSTGNWTNNAGGPPGLYSFSFRATKRVGSTTTDNATAIGGSAICTNATAAVISGHTMTFVDITKGSPNYTFNTFSKSINPNPVQVTQADFLAQVVSGAPSFSQHDPGTNRTLAVDESTGTFTHVNIGWDQAAPTIEICDLAVVRLA